MENRPGAGATIGAEALAKSKPGQLSYASSGIGGLQHLNAEMFKQMAGINLVHVPYQGTAQFLPDLMAGRG